ncbi:MAG: hypothetical protein M3457_11920, partial [Chloroflexota bacterium]|nr:hypothetical protein [Chloroflexota bacterium]
MKRVSLVQVGFGTVGGALIDQVIENRPQWRDQFGLDVTIAAVAGRSGATVADDASGLDDSELRRLVNGRRSGAGSPTQGSV